MNTDLPPLKFIPIIKSVTWGGRKLDSLFRKVLPDSVPCGESWEIVDLPDDQSVVSVGPLASNSLASLVETHREALLGEVPLLMGRFPVLFKLLDAQQTLSVQVHPDEEACRRLGAGARPKTEAWYILQTDPGAKLYLGLNDGVSRTDFVKALEAGTVGELLREITVKPGDFIYLPSGTLHAIGAGIVLAEIQQASDTTYRVFDWNRVGLDGKPRQLHVAQALDSINFDINGKPPHAPPPSGRQGIACKAFTFERIGLAAAAQVPLDAARARILCCIEGSGVVTNTGTEPLSLTVGETCLLPACRAESLTSEQGGVFLLIRV
ncbi:MAG: class I mannose-6-phosphate isomerase [Deltaproteobacteria bacterium]|nr:class I mannose-6-phosphate isomerase [Deltaproteobacteria bacterium]